MFEEETKKCNWNLSTKNINFRESLSMAEVEPYWKSLWGEEAELNGSAQWMSREERSKINNSDLEPIQIM
jgi:hypothetical protein